MKIHYQQKVENIFFVLNSSGIDWILLRNTNNELPDNLRYDKDVDILVRPEMRHKIHNHLLNNKFKCVKHPLRYDIRLYGVDEFKMYVSDTGVKVDINFQVAVRSLDRGQWIPLDQDIQNSIWADKKKIMLGDVAVQMPSDEDLFVLTISRCVFDKKIFSTWHAKLLSAIILRCDINAIEKKLRLIFFSFTNRLLEIIRREQYESIIIEYLKFSEY